MVQARSSQNKKTNTVCRLYTTELLSSIDPQTTKQRYCWETCLASIPAGTSNEYLDGASIE